MALPANANDASGGLLDGITRCVMMSMKNTEALTLWVTVVSCDVFPLSQCQAVRRLRLPLARYWGQKCTVPHLKHSG